MAHMRRLGAALAGAIMLAAGGAAPASAADKFALVHGCYALQGAGGQLGLQGDRFVAGAGSPEAFRLQATALGRYLLYDRKEGFLTASGARAATPSPAADFTVDGDGPFTLTAQDGTKLAGGPFAFVPAEGCAVYPEAEVNATGTPGGGSTPYTATTGLLDAHMHLMGFEFLGGKAHCGRPWHPYGVAYALNECEDGPAGNQATTAVETVLGGGAPGDDPKGWPTFKSWPSPDLLAHEGSYYKWLERAWRGGLRSYVNLYVENHALCELFPLKKNSCNEMDSVRLQVKRLKELQDYIDAQEGGPGKGWFRIVADPFEARRVINAGKLAVIPGIEVSTLFDCGVRDGVTQCTNDQIDKRLDEAYALGVRDMELTNKFDNGFAGVAGDNGQQGVVVNAGNKLETGQFWAVQTCTGPKEEVDREQITAPQNLAQVFAGTPLAILAGAGTTPTYPPGPHCNARGLTTQGEHLVRRMMARGMIIDPDHLSVKARKSLLDIVEAKQYSGIISSHTWSSADAYERIYKLGGVVTPIAQNSAGFVEKWKAIKPARDKSRRLFGFGYGADLNGFAHQGEPRLGAKNPVEYPFKSLDGKVTLERNQAGSRTWDINVDGVAQYGLYPDWIEDLRKQAGNEIVEDMGRGSEMYLQMWERAVGVADPGCRAARLRFTRQGIGLMKLGASAEDVLRGAGQPLERQGRRFSYCARGGGKLSAIMSPAGKAALLVSTAPRHRVAGLGRGSRASSIRGARRVGSLRVKAAGGGRQYVYGVRGGTVRFAGVASAEGAKALRSHLKLAGL